MELKKVLLVHGLDSMELAKLQLSNHKVVVINNENGGSLLKDLILQNEENIKKTESELPNERVIIFSDYSDEELKQNIVTFRFMSTQRPMLAVVTENSYEWSFEYLLTEHLIKDRDENRRLLEEQRKKQ